jgi:prefoldin subunit 5
MMDIFNNKKVLQLESELEIFREEFETIKGNIVKIDKQIRSIEKISEEWDEYKKWKEMKDKLPDIEEMYNLQELKRLTNMRNILYPTYLKQEQNYYNSLDRTGFTLLKSPQVYQGQVQSLKKKIEDIESRIKKKLESIKKLKTREELVGVLKLYAISTDWLSPNWYKK